MNTLGTESGHEAYANEVGFAAIIGLTHGKIACENAGASKKRSQIFRPVKRVVLPQGP